MSNFLWQTLIQTIEYDLNDAKRIKKETLYIATLLIYTLWHEFSNDFDAQSDFDKICHKKSTHLDHSYL